MYIIHRVTNPKHILGFGTKLKRPPLEYSEYSKDWRTVDKCGWFLLIVTNHRCYDRFWNLVAVTGYPDCKK